MTGFGISANQALGFAFNPSPIVLRSWRVNLFRCLAVSAICHPESREFLRSVLSPTAFRDFRIKGEKRTISISVSSGKRISADLDAFETSQVTECA